MGRWWVNLNLMHVPLSTDENCDIMGTGIGSCLNLYSIGFTTHTHTGKKVMDDSIEVNINNILKLSCTRSGARFARPHSFCLKWVVSSHGRVARLDIVGT